MPYCKNCGNEIQPDAKFCPRCGTPVEASQQATPSAEASPMMPRLEIAFWGERFLAWLIDVVLLGIFVGILGLVTWFAWEPFGFWPSWFPLFNFGSGGLIYFLYWTLLEGSYGQSLGKMIMHLRVTRIDGGRIGIANAALESVGKAFLLILDVLIGWALYPRRRQRIFNYLSETIVIRERRT